ncbi:MAG: sigma-E processing peptidase SpoIIGA [Clostridia bacterium]|nr:sigma-E processing peptidase SpoIIGA [Clostridia bacterium]
MINLKTVIYADVLIIVNLIINYLLLRASAAMTGCNFKTRRFLLSSAIGGLFSLIIFIDNITVAANILIKLLFFAVIVITAFGIKSVKAFLKNCATFALVNFGFAGIMFALCTTVIPNAAIYKNGIVYFDVNILTLTVSAIICYCVLSIISRFTKSKVPQKSIYEIKIYYEEKTIECKALFDSGNTLCDCFSGRPVIICEKEFISKLYKSSDLTAMKNFRLIPFSTIKSGGALPSFLADKIEINIKGKWIESKEIYIAVTERKIVSGGYSALFGVPFLDTVENSIKGGTIAV